MSLGHSGANSSVMLTPINTYGPSLIKSLGFKGYSAVCVSNDESS